MKKVFYILYSIFLLSACQSEVEKEEVEVPAIRASKLFYADSVYSYMMVNGDKYQHFSHSYLKKAKEEKDPEKAMWYFKRAISLYPQVDSYRELGKLCIQSAKYDEAFNCFTLIIDKSYIKQNGEYQNIQIFGKPNSEDFENYIISCLLGNRSMYNLTELVYNAVQCGADKKQLQDFVFNDSRIDIQFEPLLKKQLEIVFLGEDELKDYALNLDNFKFFIQDLKVLDNPYLLNFDDVQKFNYSSYNNEFDGELVDISYLESSFLPQKKNNPDKYLKYNKIGKQILPDSNILIIYSVDESIFGVEKQKRIIEYYGAIYSNNNQLLDFKKLAWQDDKITGTLKLENFEFEISIFTRIWEKKEEILSPDNELKNIVFQKKETYKIENGKFLLKS